LWALSLELASCHSSDVYNSEVAPTFLKNSCTRYGHNVELLKVAPDRSVYCPLAVAGKLQVPVLNLKLFKPGSSGSIVTTDESQFDSLLRQYIFLLFKASRPTVKPVRWVPAAAGRGREGSHWHRLVPMFRFSEAVSLHPHISTLSFTCLWSPSQFCAHSHPLTHKYSSVPAGRVKQSSSSP
jgi:hypothetical protein